jgi:hypothetical protein
MSYQDELMQWKRILFFCTIAYLTRQLPGLTSACVYPVDAATTTRGQRGSGSRDLPAVDNLLSGADVLARGPVMRQV